MQYKVNYTIKAEVFDKLKQETINFTVDKEIILDESENLLYNNYHLVGSGSIYEHLDHEIDMYAKAEGMALEDLRVDFFEVFCDDNQLEIFFAHPENKNEFTLYPDLYIHIYKKEIEVLDRPILEGELITSTSIRWSFNIPDNYLKTCGHYVFDENDKLIAQLPVGKNYFIETGLKHNKNYTRKVKRYTDSLTSEYSYPLTMTTGYPEQEVNEQSIKPFDRDWYNEENFELISNNRLKPFKSGIGYGDDLKLMELSTRDINNDMPIKYRLYGTKSRYIYRASDLSVTLKLINDDHLKPGDNHDIPGFYVTETNNYLVNGYKENSVTLGKKNVNLVSDIKSNSFYSDETIDKVIYIQKDGDRFTNDNPSFDGLYFDSFQLFIRLNSDEILEEEMKLFYVTDDGQRIDLEYSERDPKESFDSYIKSKLLQGIIPIESNSFETLKNSTEDGVRLNAISIMNMLKKFEFGYYEKIMQEIGPWESDEFEGKIDTIDKDKSFVTFIAEAPKLIDGTLQLNELIEPIYMSQYIDNPNISFIKNYDSLVIFEGDNIEVTKEFDYNKSTNPMYPTINKGYYYLNNLEMYTFNNSELKINKFIEEFEKENIAINIKYKAIVGDEEYLYEKNIRRNVKLDGDTYFISDKTVEGIINEHYSEINEDEVSELQLISINKISSDSTTLTLIAYTLQDYIVVSTPMKAKSYSYDNRITLDENDEYILEGFQDVAQEKIILRNGFTPFKRVVNKEDDKKLEFVFTHNGIDKKTYRLPHINVDQNTLEIKINGQLTDEYFIHNNNIVFNRIITKEETIKIKYKIRNSFIVFEENGMYKIKVNTDLPNDFDVYYETKDTPEPIDAVSLNPLYNGITEGYLYIDNYDEDIKRFEVEVNDNIVNYSKKEFTFGKIIAIDEFGNNCPGIKIFYDAQYGEIELMQENITNENGVVSFKYIPPQEACEDVIIVTHPDVNEIKKVFINVQ